MRVSSDEKAEGTAISCEIRQFRCQCVSCEASQECVLKAAAVLLKFRQTVPQVAQPRTWHILNSTEGSIVRLLHPHWGYSSSLFGAISLGSRYYPVADAANDTERTWKGSCPGERTYHKQLSGKQYTSIHSIRDHISPKEQSWSVTCRLRQFTAHFLRQPLGKR